MTDFLQNSGWLLDLLCVAVVVGLVYIPRSWWAGIMGLALHEDGLHHWNFFMLDPALSLRSGMALGTDRYCQYGVGWALLLTSPVAADFTS